MAATLTLMHNGLTSGVPGVPNHEAKRGGIAGWSAGAARRNLSFLYSIDGDALALDGSVGYAFTLTVLDCPETPQQWANAVNRFLLSMRRTYGCIRFHWVIEWQKRQVPHLHGCLYFNPARIPKPIRVLDVWCETAECGARPLAQTVTPIFGLRGWLQYVAKHAARGVKHYQRAGTSIPEAWRGRTGRMWGHRGNWPLAPARKVYLAGREGDGAFFAFRRLARSWRIADARRAGDARRIGAARRMLKCGDRKRSEVRGVSEWIDHAQAVLILANLLARGYSIGLPGEPPAVVSPGAG